MFILFNNFNRNNRNGCNNYNGIFKSSFNIRFFKLTLNIYLAIISQIS